MIGVNFAIILVSMGVIAATLVALALHLFHFYHKIQNHTPRPWLDKEPHNQTVETANTDTEQDT